MQVQLKNKINFKSWSIIDVSILNSENNTSIVSDVTVTMFLLAYHKFCKYK